MSALQAAFLGILQGLTEFLPVSSSGHLVLGQAVLGIDPPGVVFEVSLHVATLLAVCWVYRLKILELARGVIVGDGDSYRYVGLLFLASVPVGIVGLGFASAIESAFSRPAVAAALLLVTGGIVWTLRRTAPRAGRPAPGIRDAALIGLAQAVAILPGISRSGSTVAMGIALGVSPPKMAEFSFLLSVPAIVGAAAVQLPAASTVGGRIGLVPLAVAFAAAAVSGVFAIRIFVRMLRAHTFHRFAYYCWIVGGLYLLAAAMWPGLR